MGLVTTVAVLAATTAIAVGLWLLIQTARGTVVVAAGRGSGPRSPVVVNPVVLAAAVAVGLLVLVTSRLVVAAVAAALVVSAVPGVVEARRRRTRAIEKMRASSEFVDAIRGALGAGQGLEAAIVEAAHRPPDALSEELQAFVEYSRLPEVTIEQALRRLAADAGEPAIDLLVGSLLAALRGAAGEMGQLFERIADSGREFAELRASTQTERARVEFQTTLLSVLVVLIVLLSVVVSPDLTSAYGPSALGQLRLLIPASVFGLGWWWLNRLNTVETQHRFTLRVDGGPTVPTGLDVGAEPTTGGGRSSANGSGGRST